MQPGEVINSGQEKPKDQNPDNAPKEAASNEAGQDAYWQYQAESDPNSTETVQSAGSVSWTASEYVAHQKSAGWYILFGSASAVLTLAVFWFTKQNYLSASVVILVCLAIAVFAARQPQTVKYDLNDTGIHVGQKFYPYRMFKSFAIIDEEGISSIWLRPLKRFMPTVNMYFAPDDEEKIVDMLDNFLPREDRDHDMVDRLSRRFRF